MVEGGFANIFYVFVEGQLGSNLTPRFVTVEEKVMAWLSRMS